MEKPKIKILLENCAYVLDNVKRYFMGLLFITLIILLGSCNEKNQKPNIVLIMADDMGFSDIGCYGGEIETPTLDSLAKNGIRFSQFYNAARCCPTRASLLTGLYPVETGIGWMVGNLGYPGYEGFLNERCVTIAEALKEGGYQTYMSGKWHLGEQEFSQPITRGFDKFYGTLNGAGSYFNPKTLMNNQTPVLANNPGYYYTDAISDSAAQFIRDHLQHNKKNPFFLYVSYTAPHWPLHAPEEMIQKYDGVYDKGWDAIRQARYKRLVELGIINSEWEITPRDSDVRSWEKEENKNWRARCMQVYAAQIDIMDQGIGRIVNELKHSNQLDNTLIIFLSDNGGCSNELKSPGWLNLGDTIFNGKPMQAGSDPSIMPGGPDTYASYGLPWANVSNTPFREYKIWTHEGGIATPFIAHFPKKINKTNTIVHQPAHIIDIMATFLDLADMNYPEMYNGNQIKPTKGKSLLPVFKGNNETIHNDFLFWEHTGKRAARKGKWKIVSLAGKDWELYNMEIDRTELNDLSLENPGILQELESAYDHWANNNGVLTYEEWLKARNRARSNN